MYHRWLCFKAALHTFITTYKITVKLTPKLRKGDTLVLNFDCNTYDKRRKKKYAKILPG